jgi:ribosomal protein L37AE/L43A
MFIEIQEIQKEQVPQCTYAKLSSIKQESSLRSQLHKAMILGNTHRGKVSIVFCDDEGLKKVTTTVWAVGEKFITLKGGVWIPISKIVDIIF